MPQVPTEEAKKVADLFGIPFYETSAKDGTNVEESWAALVRATRRSLQLSKPNPDPDVSPVLVHLLIEVIG
jgi:hypothetical protein